MDILCTQDWVSFQSLIRKSKSLNKAGIMNGQRPDYLIFKRKNANLSFLSSLSKDLLLETQGLYFKDVHA